MAVKTERLTLEFDVATITARGAEIIKDIARRELAQQKALGNGPHVLTVDGRRRVTIDRAKRRIQADFAAIQLEEAIRYVEAAMARRVPRRSGRLRASYYWLLNDKPVNPHGLTDFHTTDVLRYVTPEPYARTAYWYARRKFNLQFVKKVAQGARRFRALTIRDEWYFGQGITRQPGISIRMLKRFANG